MIRYLRKIRQRSNQQRMLEKIRHIGKDTTISMSVDITFPQHLSIGAGCFIGDDSILDSRGGIKIGNYSSLGVNALLLSTDHRYVGVATIPFDDVRVIKPVVMGDFVWGGANVSIMPGVTIGDGAILGLSCVITEDVPPMAIMVGNPAKIVGYRNKEQFEKLREEGKFRAMSKKARSLWIPPFIKGKYGNVLEELGFDLKSLGTKVFDDPNF